MKVLILNCIANLIMRAAMNGSFRCGWFMYQEEPPAEIMKFLEENR